MDNDGQRFPKPPDIENFDWDGGLKTESQIVGSTCMFKFDSKSNLLILVVVATLLSCTEAADTSKMA